MKKIMLIISLMVVVSCQKETILHYKTFVRTTCTWTFDSDTIKQTQSKYIEDDLYVSSVEEMNEYCHLHTYMVNSFWSCSVNVDDVIYPYMNKECKTIMFSVSQ